MITALLDSTITFCRLLSFESSLVGVAGAFFDSSWASFWKNFFWRSQRCKNSKQNTTALVITAANYATKKKEKEQYRLPSGDRADW